MDLVEDSERESDGDSVNVCDGASEKDSLIDCDNVCDRATVRLRDFVHDTLRLEEVVVVAD